MANTCSLSSGSAQSAGPDGALSGSGVCLPSWPRQVASGAFHSICSWRFMNVFELTRALVDIDSVTPNETAVGEYLFAHLDTLARRTGGRVERLPVEPG